MTTRLLSTRSIRRLVSTLAIVLASGATAGRCDEAAVHHAATLARDLAVGNVYRYSFERREFPLAVKDDRGKETIDWGVESRATVDLIPVASNRFELRYVEVVARYSPRKRSTSLPVDPAAKKDIVWRPSAETDGAPLTIELRANGRMDLVSGTPPRDTGANRAVAKLFADLPLVVGAGVRDAELAPGKRYAARGGPRRGSSERVRSARRRPSSSRGVVTVSQRSVDLVYRGAKVSSPCSLLDFAVSTESVVTVDGASGVEHTEVGRASYRSTDGFLHDYGIKIRSGFRRTGDREFSIRLESVSSAK